MRTTSLGFRQDPLDFSVGTRDDVHGDQLAYTAGSCGARVGGGLDGAHVSTDEDGHVSGADVLLGDEHHVGRFDHGIRRFNCTDEAFRFYHSECVSGHVRVYPEGTLAEVRSIIPPEMYRALFTSAALTLAAVTAFACSRPTDTSPALVSTPVVTIDRVDASVASPIEMTYRFVALPGAALSKDYTVFVHFLDADGEIMWTDDHQPSVPTSQWKPGMAVEYSRTMFIPKFPYEGPTFVEVGLYESSTGERVQMEGESTGQRAYRVASFNLRLQSDAPFMVFTDGWHPAEVSAEGNGIEWQWTRKEGTLAFKNPMRDAVLYLEVDQPVAGSGAHHVDVRIGSTVIDAFDLPEGRHEVRKVPVSKAQFGDADTVTMTITPDRTFTPAAEPALRNPDTRELGVRVFRVYLQPK